MVKFIGNKGKFFGVVNIIDLVIFLIVLLVASGTYYKFFHKPMETKSVNVEFRVVIPLVRPEMVQAIKVGDKLVSEDSYTSVAVKDVKIKPGYSINVNARGQKVASIDPYLVDCYVTYSGTTLLSQNVITMGGQKIQIGKDFNVKSLLYEFKGTVIQFGETRCQAPNLLTYSSFRHHLYYFC